MRDLRISKLQGTSDPQGYYFLTQAWGDVGHLVDVQVIAIAPS